MRRTRRCVARRCCCYYRGRHRTKYSVKYDQFVDGNSQNVGALGPDRAAGSIEVGPERTPPDKPGRAGERCTHPGGQLSGDLSAFLAPSVVRAPGWAKRSRVKPNVDQKR